MIITCDDTGPAPSDLDFQPKEMPIFEIKNSNKSRSKHTCTISMGHHDHVGYIAGISLYIFWAFKRILMLNLINKPYKGLKRWLYMIMMMKRREEKRDRTTEQTIQWYYRLITSFLTWYM